MSPIGEPLAMLPPIVPMLRTCSPPMRSNSGPSAGMRFGERRERLGVGDAGADA